MPYGRNPVIGDKFSIRHGQKGKFINANLFQKCAADSKSSHKKKDESLVDKYGKQLKEYVRYQTIPLSVDNVHHDLPDFIAEPGVLQLSSSEHREAVSEVHLPASQAGGGGGGFMMNCGRSGLHETQSLRRCRPRFFFFIRIGRFGFRIAVGRYRNAFRRRRVRALPIVIKSMSIRSRGRIQPAAVHHERELRGEERLEEPVAHHGVEGDEEEPLGDENGERANDEILKGPDQGYERPQVPPPPLTMRQNLKAKEKSSRARAGCITKRSTEWTTCDRRSVHQAECSLRVELRCKSARRVRASFRV
ncbi:hypothetical protein MPTK1_2g09720 [Marchantia polymorpha subsp. ruderalis]|uniref:DNA-directed RNA polymerase n=1 Tax=Marchantia polymorpha TaxID=3197 RepID=A0A2R6W483_MARPO|nr:hypothetical protein MARPO_0158s0042 [Marchantia polymorpha]BBN01712.1 hypothetical protein Mp_2g09720 [Marchantia polymorpha subsp. ruderalis]|eukprot:PTQ28667.1 hypothetical protein MARPO_0158s0042 [Marchantia polymorpha]